MDIQILVDALAVTPNLVKALPGAVVEHKKFGTGKITEGGNQNKVGHFVKVKYEKSGSVFTYSLDKFFSTMVSLHLNDAQVKDQIEAAHLQYQAHLSLQTRQREEQLRLRSIEFEKEQRQILARQQQEELVRIEQQRKQKEEYFKWIQDNPGYAFLAGWNYDPRLKAIVERHNSKLLILNKPYRGIGPCRTVRDEVGCWGCRDALDQTFGIKCNLCGWEICSKCATCGCGHPVYDPIQTTPQ
jgi:hypothetical protein